MNDMPNRRRRPVLRWALAIGLFAVAVACVSFQPRVSGTVIDSQGKAVAGAFVVYTYDGSNHAGLVHATGYRRSGGVVRTDAVGNLTIGSRVLFTQPLVSGIAPIILAVYSPDRRSGVGLMHGEFDVVLPASGGPREWFLCLEEFNKAVEYGIGRGELDLNSRQHGELRELITDECERFLTVHGVPNRDDARPWSEAVLRLLELNKANPIR